MARIVELKDQSPLLVKAENLHNGVCAVCRCGLSGNWPYCDGTHKATAGEEPGKLYRYERELPQGAPRRIEVGEAGMHVKEGHGAGAAPSRPPRPPAQHGAARPAMPPELGHGEPSQRAAEEGVPPPQ